MGEALRKFMKLSCGYDVPLMMGPEASLPRASGERITPVATLKLYLMLGASQPPLLLNLSSMSRNRDSKETEFC